jgi:hypothetical protein
MAEKIEPLRMSHFGMAQHQYQQFNAEVKAGTTPEQLEDPHFWSHVKQKLRLFDEIRVIAEDSSFLAKVLVTFADGNRVRTKVVYGVELEAADPEQIMDEESRYYIKQRGRLGWCVIDRQTDQNIREGIRTRSDAMRELEDHLKALAA